jgi:hypothetical protein
VKLSGIELKSRVFFREESEESGGREGEMMKE